MVAWRSGCQSMEIQLRPFSYFIYRFRKLYLEGPGFRETSFESFQGDVGKCAEILWYPKIMVVIAYTKWSQRWNFANFCFQALGLDFHSWLALQPSTNWCYQNSTNNPIYEHTRTTLPRSRFHIWCQYLLPLIFCIFLQPLQWSSFGSHWIHSCCHDFLATP